jgi:ribosomal protein S18 acetylase RimI-like enzyme
MEESVQISILAPHQWQEYKEIRLKALQAEPDAFAWTYEELAQKPDEYWKERVSLETGFYFIARRGNQNVGTAGLHLKSNGADDGTASIVGVFVDKAFRRRGIGQSLLNAILDTVREYDQIEKVRIVVKETQDPAKALYKKMGFESVETIDGNEVILEKVLK